MQSTYVPHRHSKPESGPGSPASRDLAETASAKPTPSHRRRFAHVNPDQKLVAAMVMASLTLPLRMFRTPSLLRT